MTNRHIAKEIAEFTTTDTLDNAANEMMVQVEELLEDKNSKEAKSYAKFKLWMKQNEDEEETYSDTEVKGPRGAHSKVKKSASSTKKSMQKSKKGRKEDTGKDKSKDTRKDNVNKKEGKGKGKGKNSEKKSKASNRK